MRWTYLKRSTSTLPVRGNGKRLLPTSVRCSPRTIIRPQDILLRLLNWRFYIGPHVQVHLAGLNTEWEERLTRWTLSVQSALEAGDVLPPLSAAVVASLEGTDSSLEDDRSADRQLEQGDAVLGSTESRQATGSRGATLVALYIYCGRALDDFGGESEFDHLWATTTCAHGEFVLASCMLDRAERLACGHTDPWPCVMCHSEWSTRSRPPIRQNWPRIYPDHGRGEGGRRSEVSWKSPNFLKRKTLGWCRPVI